MSFPNIPAKEWKFLCSTQNSQEITIKILSWQKDLPKIINSFTLQQPALFNFNVLQQGAKTNQDSSTIKYTKMYTVSP